MMDSYTNFGILLLCLIYSISQVAGDADVSVKFVSYESDGTLSNGHCCDNWPVCNNACDFKFEICCTLGEEAARCFETGVVKKNRNSLTFRQNMAGVDNPIQLHVTDPAPERIRLQVNVEDRDGLSGNDDVDSLSLDMDLVKDAETEYQLSSRTTLDVVVEMKCSEDWFGQDCGTHCPPAPLDNYVCDESTGQRTCVKGWRGSDCGEQYKIHENDCC